MPSPVGHALGGLTAGWAVEACLRTSRPPRAAAALAYATLGMAPDLDLLLGFHRGPTHSLSAALLAGLAAFVLLRGRSGAGRVAAACAAAWGSHVLLDWLGTDTSPPAGIMALWPWSRAYLEAPFQVFLAVSRRFHQPELFWVPNLRALVRELIVLLPAAALVARWRGLRLSAAAR
jgi:membrane-bound metal-dependent hydrolase YbcI (DUF457 family)